MYALPSDCRSNCGFPGNDCDCLFRKFAVYDTPVRTVFAWTDSAFTGGSHRALRSRHCYLRVSHGSAKRKVDRHGLARSVSIQPVHRHYEKISSSYVHTYGKVTVTPSLNSSGTVSFSLSNTSYAWTIASSVSANF